MLRLFAGLALPPEQRLTLSTLCHGVPGVSWVDAANFHVTLRFIGDVDEGMAADIDDRLATIKFPRFELSIAGMGLFGPDDKPRTIWAGLDRAAPLPQLRDKIDHALMRAGLPPEGRRFAPHVTLGHVRNGSPIAIQRFVAEHNLLRLPGFEVESFQLIRSWPTKAGSIYEDVAAYPLR
jgi:RNA 2',3'-cyclic 3'-phosphodiesterase